MRNLPWPRPNAFLIATLFAALAFCLLAGLVAGGELSAIDTYAVHRLMPFGAGIGHTQTSLFERLVAYKGDQFHLGQALRLPASVLGSVAATIVGCSILWRRGRRSLAVLSLTALFLENVVETVGKLLIAKPPIYVSTNGSPLLVGFRHSFPSGHAARAAIVAAVAAFVWRRVWPLFAAWVVVVVVSAELDAIHTPSDLAGGLLLSSALIFGLLTLEKRIGWRIDERLTGGVSKGKPRSRTMIPKSQN